MVAGTLCDTKAASLPLSMARRIPRDVNATALDVSNKTAKRARLLRQRLGKALLLSQSVLKRRRLLPLVIDLLDVRVFVAMPVLLGCQLCVSAPGNKLISGR